MNKKFIPYHEVEKMINNLAKQIEKSNQNYNAIVGIANGGLNISYPLALKLGIKHLSIKVSYYGELGHSTSFPQIIDVTSLINYYEGNQQDIKILIVDDIADSGQTLQWLQDNIGTYYPFDAAVLYLTDYSIYKPKYYVKKHIEGTWIVFPWEKEE